MSEVMSSDIVEVKNISKRKINLAKGTIEAGKFGKATRAELQCHGKSIELVEDKEAAPKKAVTAKKDTSNSLL